MTAPQIDDDHLPTSSDLQALKSCSVQDVTGKAHRLSDLFDQASSSKTNLVLIFVRHFHCGYCLQYLSVLCEHSAIVNKDPSIKVIVIGHGQPSAIQRYADLTGCAKAGVDIYTDPDKEAFKALGVTKKTLAGLPSGEQLPAYASGKSQLSMVWSSLKEMAGVGTQALKDGGGYSQLGGEFIFDASGESVDNGRGLVCTSGAD